MVSSDQPQAKILSQERKELEGEEGRRGEGKERGQRVEVNRKPDTTWNLCVQKLKTITLYIEGLNLGGRIGCHYTGQAGLELGNALFQSQDADVAGVCLLSRIKRVNSAI